MTKATKGPVRHLHHWMPGVFGLYGSACWRCGVRMTAKNEDGTCYWEKGEVPIRQEVVNVKA